MKSSMIAMAVLGCFSAVRQDNAGGGSPKSALSPEKVAKGQEKAEANNATAGFSPEGYGKQMAEGYLSAFGKASQTWQDGVIHLLKTCNDVQQEKAMAAALKIADDSTDEGASGNLKKRISEARRVFRASREDYTATLKHMEGKGTWHAKVASLPKASTKGRKAGQGAGKSTARKIDPKMIETEVRKVIGKDATPAQVAKVIDMTSRIAKKAEENAKADAEAVAEAKAKTGTKHAKPDLGMVVGEVKMMSPADCRKVIDVALFSLSQCPDKALAAAAKDAMKVFDAIDNKAVLEKTGTDSK